MTQEEVNILIAEPQWIIREGLKSLLNRHKAFYKIDEVEDEKFLEKKLSENCPDVVLMSADGNDEFNVELINTIERNNPKCRTVVFSNNLKQSFIFKVVENGAIGFISKNCEDHEILNAIKAAVKGHKYFCGAVLDIMLHKNLWNKANHNNEDLSRREIEVLNWICQGFTNKEVADKLFLSVHTINTHRKNIMRKMEVKSSAELISNAIKKGLVV